MIFSFSSDTVPALNVVGGKARSLIEASQAGFKVHNGFVLGVEFFGPWFAQVYSGADWQTFLGASDEQIRTCCDAIKDDCATLTLSPEQTSALNGALSDLNQNGLFAVRSSSPEEDLAGSSFAGGYETVLGVSQRSLQAAIVHCFASVFDERIVRYKQQHDMPTDTPRIAVIVQEQVASEVSGVAFSLNPQNNCYDEAVINANFGLGESVVDGQITPDTFVVDKVAGNVLEKNIGSKTHAIWLQPDGGTQERNNEHPQAACLTDTQALEVARLATQAEQHYGAPMDIEWAYQGEQLYLLQSRPITTYIPLPDEMVTQPGAQKSLYLDIIVLTQGFSDSLSVLGGPIWGKMLDHVKGDVGLRDYGMNGTIVNLHGRQYMHLSNMYKMMGSTIGKAIEQYDTPTQRIIQSVDLKRDYTPTELPAPLKGLAWKATRFAFKLLPGMIKGLANQQKATVAYDQGLTAGFDTCREMVKQDLPFDELVDALMRLFREQVLTITGVLLPAMLARARLARLFKGNDDANDLLIALQMNLDGNPTAEMGHLMYELAAADELQATQSGAEFEDRINRRTYSAGFMAKYDAYMERFGCRGIKEIDIGTPRGYEHLPGFFQQISAIDVSNNTIHSTEARRQAAYDQLLELARTRGKESKFRKLEKAQRAFGHREAPKFFYIYAVDLLRRRALELGEQFVAEKRLADKHQIFNLTPAQVSQAQADSTLELLPIIDANLARRARLDTVRDWPRVIDSRGKIIRAPRPESADGLVGDPIAPGVVRGRANVLHEPYEKPLLKGEILVTKASDPGWTPIFINAAGVVLEVGGALQHGAIIAREYGLPCVSGLDGATTTIRDGQLIEVDGSNGIVRIIEDDVVDDAA